MRLCIVSGVVVQRRNPAAPYFAREIAMPWTCLIDTCFQNLGIEATYTSQGDDPMAVHVIARRPDEIVSLGDTRIHSETALFDVRVSEVPSTKEQ